ncbi:MAG TPA: P1 family peptidase, partial [Gemmatimonadaceae bacterium]|nr:P1 family peptidase [Gemmatimonadaceae bacterium]
MTADLSRVGLAVGHATDVEGGTGLTVIRGVDRSWLGAVEVMGRATGSRELDVLAPHALAGRVDAILLTGGSAYGLDAAAGVMRWMEEQHRGFPIAGGVVPIVPAAVLFDLGPIGRFDARPTAEMAYRATESARTRDIAEGSIGAGTGATVGKAAGLARAMKGGIGCVELTVGDVCVAAVAAVNAFGDVRDSGGRIIA